MLLIQLHPLEMVWPYLFLDTTDMKWLASFCYLSTEKSWSLLTVGRVYWRISMASGFLTTNSNSSKPRIDYCWSSWLCGQRVMHGRLSWPPWTANTQIIISIKSTPISSCIHLLIGILSSKVIPNFVDFMSCMCMCSLHITFIKVMTINGAVTTTILPKASTIKPSYLSVQGLPLIMLLMGLLSSHWHYTFIIIKSTCTCSYLRDSRLWQIVIFCETDC